MVSQALQRLRWPVPVRPEPGLGLVAVATTGTTLLTPNPNRVGAKFVNKGSNNVHIGHDGTPSTGQGYFLAALGGTLVFLYEEDGDELFEAFFGIAETAAVNVDVSALEEQAPRRP